MQDGLVTRFTFQKIVCFMVFRLFDELKEIFDTHWLLERGVRRFKMGKAFNKLVVEFNDP